MKNLVTTTVKGLDPKVYEKLKKQAKKNRRSTNKEMIVLIEEGVK